MLFLGVEPDADAIRHAAAAPGALAGRRLRDRLHAQELHLLAVAVALDAREARIDHVAHARHGERGLGHVSGEDDAPCTGRMKYAILFGGREARIERQDLDALGPAPAQ